LTHCQLHWWVWSRVVAVLELVVVLHLAVVVEFAPLASVQGRSVYWPGPEFGDSPILAGNCEPVSSDILMLDRHVCILHKFMFYIYRD
jgi:hypothetical protein